MSDPQRAEPLVEVDSDESLSDPPPAAGRAAAAANVGSPARTYISGGRLHTFPPLIGMSSCNGEYIGMSGNGAAAAATGAGPLRRPSPPAQTPPAAPPPSSSSTSTSSSSSAAASAAAAALEDGALPSRKELLRLTKVWFLISRRRSGARGERAALRRSATAAVA